MLKMNLPSLDSLKYKGLPTSRLEYVKDLEKLSKMGTFPKETEKALSLVAVALKKNDKKKVKKLLDEYKNELSQFYYDLDYWVKYGKIKEEKSMNLIDKYLGESVFNLTAYKKVLKQLEDQKEDAMKGKAFGSWIKAVDNIEKSPIEAVFMEDGRIKEKKYKNLKAAIAEHPAIVNWHIGMRGKDINGVPAIRIEDWEVNDRLSR